MSRQKIKNWLENVYNCPYLILVVVSSVVAMLCFDEIGIRVFDHNISAERTVSVVGDIVRAEENQTLAEPPVTLEEVQNTEETEAENKNLFRKICRKPMKMQENARKKRTSYRILKN